MNKREKSLPSNPSPNSFMQQNERKSLRTRSPRGTSPSGRMSRWPYKIQNACTTRPRVVAVLVRSTHSHIVRLTHSRRNGLSRIMTNALWLYWKKGNWQEREFVSDACHDRTEKPVRKSGKKLGQKSSQRRSSDARQLGCVFQDMTPPKSILRKCTDMPKPIQRVKFTKAIARRTKIRHQNPSLGCSCLGEPHKRSPNAPKFEDRSREETEWQEQGAREAAWKLAKNVLKLKEHERATFFSLSENRCLPASTLKLDWGTRICCRLRFVNTHDQQKRTWVMLKWILWRNRAVLR